MVLSLTRGFLDQHAHIKLWTCASAALLCREMDADISTAFDRTPCTFACARMEAICKQFNCRIWRAASKVSFDSLWDPSPGRDVAATMILTAWREIPCRFKPKLQHVTLILMHRKRKLGNASDEAFNRETPDESSRSEKWPSFRDVWSIYRFFTNWNVAKNEVYMIIQIICCLDELVRGRLCLCVQPSAVWFTFSICEALTSGTQGLPKANWSARRLNFVLSLRNRAHDCWEPFVYWYAEKISYRSPSHSSSREKFAEGTGDAEQSISAWKNGLAVHRDIVYGQSELEVKLWCSTFYCYVKITIQSMRHRVHAYTWHIFFWCI